MSCQTTPVMSDSAAANSAPGIPRFMQLTELLQREILGGQYLPGDRLPPESQLAAKLGVAVGTLRKALAELESRKVLERRQGSGTYVKKSDQLAPAARAAMYQFFRLELLDGGGLPGANVVSVDHLSCANTARQLQIAPRAKHWRIRRLRSLNQKTIAGEEICIAAQHAKRLRASDLAESLYEHYREHFNQWVVRVEDAIGCEAAPGWLTEALPTANTWGSCGVVQRTAWNQHDAIIEVSRTWFDSSECRYTARWS